jgi:hypothetical protein
MRQELTKLRYAGYVLVQRTSLKTALICQQSTRLRKLKHSMSTENPQVDHFLILTIQGGGIIQISLGSIISHLMKEVFPLKLRIRIDHSTSSTSYLSSATTCITIINGRHDESHTNCHQIAQTTKKFMQQTDQAMQSNSRDIQG